MIGYHSTDRSTTTPDDAAAFERARHGAYDRDVPSAAELAEDAAVDAAVRVQREREDAALRARGEYVPSDVMRLTASSLTFALDAREVRGMTVAVVREGVLSVAPEAGRAPQVDPQGVVAALTAIYGDDAEVVMGDRRVWVRIVRTTFADPFVVGGVAQDNPPF